ncbi:MAG: hypothetical protein ABIH34_01415 [Nanoarchaeota archaeon]
MKKIHWIIMGIIIIALLIAIVVFVKGIKIPGSSSCEADSDCVRYGGCDPGCYSRTPKDIGLRIGICGREPPQACVCVENQCQSA